MMKNVLMKSIFLLFPLLLFLPGTLQAAPEKRSALIIGNSYYETGPLKNPANDATDIASALKRLGFSVTLRKNVNLQTMEETIREFGDRLKRGGVGLFYYAGHGIQIAGKNYLIPIDAEIKKETDVKYQAVDVEMLLDEMGSAGNNMNIVILDACRDNPLARSFRTAGRGLAITPSAPKGTLITYSTGPGKVAADGRGRNSPYTAALIKYIAKPDIPIEDVFKMVRKELGVITKGQQVPWELSSLEGYFSFNPQKADVGIDESVRDTEPQVLNYDNEQKLLEEKRKMLQREKKTLDQSKALLEGKERLRDERKRPEESKQKSATTPQYDMEEPTGVIELLNANVTDLKFFSSDDDTLAPIGKRFYTKSFSRTLTPYINWELNLIHPKPGRRVDFKIEDIWFGPNKNEIYRSSRDFYIDEDSLKSSQSNSLSRNNFSSKAWKDGYYRVDLYIDGKKIASGTFKIYYGYDMGDGLFGK
jgi:hypothetical protein